MANIIKPENRRGKILDMRYHGNVSSLGTWYDISGNGNNGILNANAFVDNQGVNFDGAGDYVSTQVEIDTDSGNTIIGNFKIVNKSVKTCFLGAQTSTGQNCRAYVGLNDTKYWIGLGETQIFTESADEITNNEWFSLALSLNGTSFIYYINGESATSGTYTSGGNCPFGLSIGSLNFEGSSIDFFLNGNSDNIKIYNRELSAEEIKQIYHTTRRY